jgi:hypothetical protein
VKVGATFSEEELDFRVVSMSRTRPVRISIMKTSLPHEG